MAVLGFDVRLERFNFCSNTARFRLIGVISVNKDLKEDAGIYRRNHRPRMSSIYRSTASRFFTTPLNARKRIRGSTSLFLYSNAANFSHKFHFDVRLKPISLSKGNGYRNLSFFGHAHVLTPEFLLSYLSC